MRIGQRTAGRGIHISIEVVDAGSRCAATKRIVGADGELGAARWCDIGRVGLARYVDDHAEVVSDTRAERDGRGAIGRAVIGVDVAGRVETNDGRQARISGLCAARESQSLIGRRDARHAVEGSREATRLIGDSRIDETIAVVDRRAAADA